MSEATPTIIVEKPLTLRDILARVSLPSALFGFSLLGFVAASWIFLVPQLLTIEVSGVAHRMGDLQGYRAELQTKILTAEEARQQALRAVQSPQYQALLDARVTAPSSFQIREQIDETIRKLDDRNAVHIQQFSFTPGTREVQISGEVRGVGPRSMTVLAAWVDVLRSAAFVRDFRGPEFTRAASETNGPYSPFTMSWILP
jgi:hypothetical protein